MKYNYKNMILVLLILVIFSGAGFYLFKMEQERSAEEKRIADAESAINDTSKFIGYTECDYKGTPLRFEDDTGTFESNTGIKSIVIPKGFTVDTYTKQDKGGIKISYSGPIANKCLSTPIPHMTWSKK